MTPAERAFKRFMDVARDNTGGKACTAPCGHPGEHVSASIIRCTVGCDKPRPKVNARADTEPGHGPPRAPECAHVGAMNFWNKALGQMQNRCIDCDVLLSWDDDDRKWRAQ